ncbi:hypothetical protein GGR50DRAFT_621632 [Xylaria sp. CBS 124048]|nr:hypothetical protein GGR50DRAFT_621632 [Xylaria sp. CBS 124048]
MTNLVFLSPALPAELLSYILNHHVYPTTLIICSSKSEFLESIVQDIRQQPNESTDGEQSHHYDPKVTSQRIDKEDTRVINQEVLSSPLYQVATSRHIRVVYVPTVTHLRAYLSVFSPDDSHVPAPPPLPPPTSGAAGAVSDTPQQHIILYGFLELHRDTSEWSVQGLSNTTSALVELTHRLSWQTLLVEPRHGPHSSGTSPLDEILRETVPILSGGVRRLGLHSEDGAWTGRTVEIGRVLSRWFSFQKAQWDRGE